MIIIIIIIIIIKIIIIIIIIIKNILCRITTSVIKTAINMGTIALLFSTSHQLQRKTSDLMLAAQQIGLNISRNRIKTMQLADTPLPVQMENEDLEDIEEYCLVNL